MADPPPYPDSSGDPGVRPGPGQTGMPRWVKVFGIAVIVAVVLLIILLLVTGGHGPGRHM